ncbi:hypothetical protein [Pseudoduganella lutea]|nr:hypothetical protein [Pseudoduganella lutea]
MKYLKKHLKKYLKLECLNCMPEYGVAFAAPDAGRRGNFTM